MKVWSSSGPTSVYSRLNAFDPSQVNPDTVTLVREMIATHDVDAVKKKSLSAGHVVDWVS